MNFSKASLVASLAAALLAGCGGIDSPDRTLSTGQVTGRLTNAKPNAYVYVFGHPEIRAQVGDGGAFELDKVPVGNGKAQIVAFDGDVRADLVDVDVQPAARKDKGDVNAAAMPLAGSIVAAVRCSGGQNGDDANYTVDGTEFQGRGGGQVVTLFPLPAGRTYTVQTKLKGFKGAQRAVQVDEGASSEVELDMDADEGDNERGCVSTGCVEGRDCNHDDGRCYECNNSSDCKNAAFPHCEEHLCVPNDNVKRSACLPCSSDVQCAGGTYAPTTQSQPGMCIANGGSKVCSYGCDPVNLDADCPSGFVCKVGAGTNGAAACFAVAACSTVLQAFGTLCLDDATCSTALADAKCEGLLKVKDKPIVPGYCTSRCTTVADCPTTLGFHCDATQLVCVR